MNSTLKPLLKALTATLPAPIAGRASKGVLDFGGGGRGGQRRGGVALEFEREGLGGGALQGDPLALVGGGEQADLGGAASAAAVGGGGIDGDAPGQGQGSCP